ncbi:C1 family peptidase [Fodinicola feengrottensis]|uniref:C1 family peptidase n=1 Tax=Fodinicola feengrottensis TaxID=435914 RepID=A0ABN2FTW1_9ACTN|nr:C1 family peptidase [Fodinicola feengrottensis]
MRSYALRTIAVVGTAACLSLGSATVAAAAPAPNQSARHGLGLRLDQPAAPSRHTGLPVLPSKSASVPTSYSLSQYAISPGDQGQVGSCVAWSTMHSGYGILMNEQGISGSPMAPMYIYAQIAQGDDEGTNGNVALDLADSQGVDTASDYWQGDFDYTTQPDSNERANAIHYKLSGYNTLSTGSGLKSAVQQSISQGMPVSVGLPVHNSFMDLDAQSASDYSYMPGQNDPVAGGHEMAVIAYNSQGVTLENSWGTNWGNSGYVNVSWTFLTRYVDEAYALGKITQS